MEHKDIITSNTQNDKNNGHMQTCEIVDTEYLFIQDQTYGHAHEYIY